MIRVLLCCRLHTHRPNSTGALAMTSSRWAESGETVVQAPVGPSDVHILKYYFRSFQPETIHHYNNTAYTLHNLYQQVQ